MCWNTESAIVNFYALGLKCPPGHQVIGSSVRPSVCLSVLNSVPLSNKVQYLKFGWRYSNQTWTVASSMGSSHFTDITCPRGLDGVKILDLEIFAIFWLCSRQGHPCFTNTCLVVMCFPYYSIYMRPWVFITLVYEIQNTVNRLLFAAFWFRDSLTRH